MAGHTIVLPVKPFAEAKTRLAPLLSPEQRAELSRRLFAHVLRTVLAVPARGDCLVVSRSAEVLAMARQAGARGVRERGLGLNAAVLQALARAPRRAGTLVISSDLPLLDRSDVEALLMQPSADVVVAADHQGDGTNALYLASPGLIDPLFGAGSGLAHQAAARAAGLRFAAVRIPGLATDLDTPADMARIWDNARARAVFPDDMRDAAKWLGRVLPAVR